MKVIFAELLCLHKEKYELLPAVHRVKKFAIVCICLHIKQYIYRPCKKPLMAK